MAVYYCYTYCDGACAICRLLKNTLFQTLAARKRANINNNKNYNEIFNKSM